MLLIKVFLKLGEFVQIPVFLPQTISWIAVLVTATSSATIATKAGRPTAIADIKKFDVSSELVNKHYLTSMHVNGHGSIM